jgi:hypothetical protein
MDVGGEELEYVVGALDGGGLVALSIFEECLYACLELGVEPPHFAMHHHQNLVVVLHPESHFVERAQLVSKRTYLDLFYGCLELLNGCFISFFLNHVDPSCEEHIREAVA